MRKVEYNEIYNLFDEGDIEAKIDLGNGEYVKLIESNCIWDLGIETNGGFYITLDCLGGNSALLLSGYEDYINTFVYLLNEYIEEQNNKEA